MFDFSAVFTSTGFFHLGQIIVGDLTMAGDNVVIMGSLASGLPEKDRKKVLLIGVSLALIFLIGFALLATQLLKITGLVFAGGMLLIWVGYNMYGELRNKPDIIPDDSNSPQGRKATKTLLQAVLQITVADLSMSLDNVLLVASIARENPALLFIGLSFSVLLMGFLANYVAKLIQRYHWIGWIGLTIILYVAGSMIFEGWMGGEHVLGLRTLVHI